MNERGRPDSGRPLCIELSEEIARDYFGVAATDESVVDIAVVPGT